MEQNIAREIGFIIRDLRNSKRISQEELAARSGLHRTYIGCIERAEKVVTVVTLEKIATALDVKLSEIFKRYENIKEGNK